MVVVQVDNYIYTGCRQEMEKFEEFLRYTFDVGEIERNSFDVYGASLSRLDDGTVIIDQKKKLSELDDLQLVTPDMMKRSGNEIANPKELNRFRSAIGRLLFIGRMTHPVLLRIASSMATKVSALELHHLKDLKALVKYSCKKPPVLVFKPPKISSLSRSHFEVYSDGSMGTKKESAARGGFIILRRFGSIVHPIFWNSRRLRRVARSSATAEILSAADAVDKSFYLSKLLEEIDSPSILELGTDSRGLFNLVCTNKEPEESMNKIDLAMMRSMFENGSIRRVFWLPGAYMIADALTKDNRTTTALLNKVLRDGEYPTHPDTIERITPQRGV